MMIHAFYIAKQQLSIRSLQFIGSCTGCFICAKGLACIASTASQRPIHCGKYAFIQHAQCKIALHLKPLMASCFGPTGFVRQSDDVPCFQKLAIAEKLLPL